MITTYLQLTQQMLADLRQEAYNPAFLKNYINIARGQLAGEARCIRVLATISTGIGQRNYNFSALNVSLASGVQGVIDIRSIRYTVGQGYKWIAPRSWPWYELYHLNNPVPVPGAPTSWAQYGQGSAGLGAITGQGKGFQSTGSFFIDPIPDAIYPLVCDCVCYPIALVVDTDVEAIPYLWTDAVPFYAVYYALLSSGLTQRMADADRYFNYYKTFVQRARDVATPDVLKYQYEQVPDPTALGQMGLSPPRGGATQ